MSDGIKGAVQQIIADAGEAVVKPVVDEVGKALEEGASAVIQGPNAQTVDPLAQQKKQEEEVKKIARAKYVIEWNEKIVQEQAKVREENKQKEGVRLKEDEEKKKVSQYKVMEQQQKKEQLTQAQLEARKAEIKRGMGG